MGAHYQYGELYMVYLKSSCTQDEIEECDFYQSSGSEIGQRYKRQGTEGKSKIQEE